MDKQTILRKYKNKLGNWFHAPYALMALKKVLNAYEQYEKDLEEQCECTPRSKCIYCIKRDEKLREEDPSIPF